MTEPGKLARTRVPMPALQPGDVVVEIRGCGVCHTDLSCFCMGVPTVQKPPLSLGHEISGVVAGGEASMIGREVIIPAVIPCGECDLCKSGRRNRCAAQKMPGNSMGIYGGFSSHIVAQAKFLCVVGDRKGTPLEHLAVIADAVTTPYQAAVRAGLGEGGRAVVIGGAVGVGSFMVQTAKGMSAKDLKEAFKAIAKAKGVPANTGWKIFECTGTKPGQETALSLLSFVGTLVVGGYGTTGQILPADGGMTIH